MRRHASWQFGQLALGWRSRSKFADLFESTLLHSTADLIDFPLAAAEIAPSVTPQDRGLRRGPAGASSSLVVEVSTSRAPTAVCFAPFAPER